MSSCLSRVLSLVLGSKTDISKMIWIATRLARQRPGRTTVATLVWAVCFRTGFGFGGGRP